MVPLTSLVVPVVLAAVLVFVASAVIHMVLPYHRRDLRRLPREDETLAALRQLAVPPGDYAAPHAGSPAGMKRPEFVEKMRQGPLVLMTISPGGSGGMGRSLAEWFVYLLVVNVFVAYLCGRLVAPGTGYLPVFRVAGTSAFMAYALGLAQQSIWYRRRWATTLLAMCDGLFYGLLTAGVFGWLWP
jgi:hypothetical protein